MVNCNLHGRIANDEIAPERIALYSSSQDDPIGIAYNGVVLNYIPSVGCGDEADTVVAALSRIAIATKPVPTEPVTACAGAQSYAPAGVGRLSITHRDIVLEETVRSTVDEDAGEAIRGCGDAGDGDAAAVEEADTEAPELLHYASPSNDDAALSIDINPIFERGCPWTIAAGLRIGKAGDGEAIQVQRHGRRTYDNAGCA